MNGKPLAIDLFCGLGGWTEGFLSEGYDVIGFDIEARTYPAELILQDVLTVHGAQLQNADILVASPPCQRYSYMAMPWTRAKQLAAWYRESPVRIAELNALFDACFRIQFEASKAAGRYIPLIIENVKGAQPWVGRAKWHYGSFYLWGDVPALMPKASARRKSKDGSWDTARANFTNDHSWDDGTKAGNDGVKVPDHTLNKVPGKQSVGFNVMAVRQMKDGSKCGGGWFGADNDMSLMRQHNSRSNARKNASAMIAKIPFPLAQHIARVYKPLT